MTSKQGVTVQEAEEKCGGLIWSQVHKCYAMLPSREQIVFSREDLYQEGCRALCEILPQYDPERGALTTFVYLILQGAFGAIVKSVYSSKRWDGVDLLSLDYDYGEGDDEDTEGSLEPFMPKTVIDETGIFAFGVAGGDPVIEQMVQDFLAGMEYWEVYRKTKLSIDEFTLKMDKLQKSAMSLIKSVYNKSVGITTSPKEDGKTMGKKKLKKPLKKVKKVTKVTKPAKGGKAKAKAKSSGEARRPIRKDGNVLKDMSKGQLEITEEINDYTEGQFEDVKVDVFHNRVCASIPGKMGRKRIYCIFKGKGDALVFHVRYLDTKGIQLNKEKDFGFVRKAHSDALDLITKGQVKGLKAFIKLRALAIAAESE